MEPKADTALTAPKAVKMADWRLNRIAKGVKSVKTGSVAKWIVDLVREQMTDGLETAKESPTLSCCLMYPPQSVSASRTTGKKWQTSP